jgi:hypothetical protein
MMGARAAVEFMAAEAQERAEREAAAPAFAFGAAVVLRKRPEISGVVTAIIRGKRAEGLSEMAWFYATSWGSCYPAFELVAVAS